MVDVAKGRENEWFLENEQELLKAAREAREKREAERRKHESEAERKKLKDAHYLHCPKCGHKMSVEKLQGISVERCSFCEGIFFDAGELERVLEGRNAETKGFFRSLLKL